MVLTPMLGGTLIYNKEGVAVKTTSLIGTEFWLTTTVKSFGGQEEGKPYPVILILSPRVEPENEPVVSEKLRFKGKELLSPIGSSLTLTE